MSIYGELDPMPEHRRQFAFKGKREHIAKENMPNMAYPNQHIDIEIQHGSRDHVIVPETVKITYNLDIESTDKARSIVNNVGRALVKKKLLMLGLKEIDTINNADIYDAYKDLYLSEKNVQRSCFKINEWFKGTARCKKGRWHRTNSHNQGKCNQNNFW